MPLLERVDRYHVYCWSRESKSRIKEWTTQGYKNVIPKDRNQVLLVINWIADAHDIEDKEIGIEKFIADLLRGWSRSEIAVPEAIEQRFNLNES